MGTEFHFDTRIRRCYVPLITQQRCLHHLHNISLRNLEIPVNKFNCDSKIGIYFTFHAHSALPAFYKSEVIYNNLNPSWKSFEVSSFPDKVNKATAVITIKIWCQQEGSKTLCLTEWTVYFSGLMYLGEQIPKGGKKFKPNTLLFGMLEGYYGSRDCFQNRQNEEQLHKPQIYMEADPSTIHASYSVNTLSRIKTVERAIVQTQAAVQRIRAKIEEKLQTAGELQLRQSQIELLRLKGSILKSELGSQGKVLECLRKQKKEQERETEDKRSNILEKCEQLKKEKEKLIEMQRLHIESRENLLKTNAKLLFRQKQLISELSDIYPITQIPDKKGFNICSVHLPNSEDFAGRDEKMLSVALGYVCHVLTMMSHFLQVPLRYPVHHYASKSTITDHITDKIPDKEREFPLYTKDKTQMHFNYGVYLLNKNIAQLRHYFNLNTQDLRATLPNLHSLIELKLSIHSEPYTGIHPSLSHMSSLTIPITTKIQLQSEPKVQNILLQDDHSSGGLASNVINETLSDKESSHAEMMAVLKKEIEEMIPKDVTEEINFPKPVKPIDINNTNLSCSLDKGLNDYKTFNQVTNWNNNNIESGKLKTKVHTLGHGHCHSSVPNLAASVSRTSFEEEALSSGDEKQRPINAPLTVWSVGNSQNNSDEEQLQEKIYSSEIHPAVDAEKWNREVSTLDINNFLPHCDDGNCDQCKQNLLDLIESTFNADLTLRTHQLALRTGSFQLQRTRTSTSSSVEID